MVGGKLPHRIKSFHDQYGPIIRIAPNELTSLTLWHREVSIFQISFGSVSTRTSPLTKMSKTSFLLASPITHVSARYSHPHFQTRLCTSKNQWFSVISMYFYKNSIRLSLRINLKTAPSWICFNGSIAHSSTSLEISLEIFRLIASSKCGSIRGFKSSHSSNLHSLRNHLTIIRRWTVYSRRSRQYSQWLICEWFERLQRKRFQKV